MSQVLPEEPAVITNFTRAQIAVAVGAGRVLQNVSPDRLQSVMRRLMGHSRPAGYDEAKRARDEILTASARCRGGSACLVRSIAVTILCRLRGRTPTWSVGVIAVPPFSAHAWIEAEGRIVDEPLEESDYRAFFKVAPRDRRSTTSIRGRETAPFASPERANKTNERR